MNMLTKIKNWIKYLVRPRYWLIKLDIDYHDADQQILYCTMEILKKFYNLQTSELGHVDWDFDEEHRKVFAEIKEIVIWWRNYNIYKKHLYTCPIGIEEPDILLFTEQDGVNKIKYQPYFDWLDTEAKIDAELDAEAQVMLKRIINIRPYLWD